MITLASAESFIGSIWFALMLGVVGYVAGQIVPISKLSEWLSRK